MDKLRPKRFISYCSWNDRQSYHLVLQMGMIQATHLRKFYIWTSFDPKRLREDPIVNFLLLNYKLYVRRHFHDLQEPQVTELYLFTNDPTYGALMEASERGHDSIPWSSSELTAQDLSGIWSRTYQLWTSRDQDAAGRLMQKMEDLACVSTSEEALVTRAEEQGLQPGSSSDVPLPKNTGTCSPDASRCRRTYQSRNRLGTY